MSTADLNFLNLNTLFVLLSQIVFEAIRGSSIRSDIAIDDVILEGGPCPGKQTETSYKKRKHAIKDFRFVTTSCLLNFFLQKWGSAPLWEPPMRSSKVQGVKTAYNAYPPPLPVFCTLQTTQNVVESWLLHVSLNMWTKETSHVVSLFLEQHISVISQSAFLCTVAAVSMCFSSHLYCIRLMLIAQIKRGRSLTWVAFGSLCWCLELDTRNIVFYCHLVGIQHSIQGHL